MSLAQLRDYSQRAEVVLNRLAAPMKPHMGHIARFLLVVTFVEDAIRILMQWSDQVHFMTQFRNCPSFVAHVFLLYCAVLLFAGSAMALTRFRMPLACVLLASVLVVQTLGYGLLTHASFMLRNFSLIGGLLLLSAEWFNAGGTLYSAFLPPKHMHSNHHTNFGGLLSLPGLPNLTEAERSTYVSLFGRLLLVLLFAALGLQGTFTPLKIVLTIFCAISCVMVAIGFKARYSAMFLVAILSISNIFINPWWVHSAESAERDFLRYDFFQILSIMGGFLLLANAGPGEMSVDASKKKEF